MGRFIAEREKLHSNLLGLHVQRGSWIADGSVRALTARAYSKSPGLAAAAGRATEVIAGRLRLQAYALTFSDGFFLIAWACVIGLIVVALLRRPPLNYGDLSEIQKHLSPSGAPK